MVLLIFFGSIWTSPAFIITISIVGTVASLIGAYLGYKSLRRNKARKPPTPSEREWTITLRASRKP